MLNPSALPFVPGRTWAPSGQQEAVTKAAPELPLPLLEHICSHVSCLVTLTRLSASSRQLKAAAARPLSELWQRWQSFTALAYIDANTPACWQAVDRAVIAFALSSAQSKALPASLDSHARFWAHTRAAQLRLATQSHGEGGQRRLHMSKPAGWQMSWAPAYVALPPRRAPLSSRHWRSDWRRHAYGYDDEYEHDRLEWPSEEEESDDWL